MIVIGFILGLLVGGALAAVAVARERAVAREKVALVSTSGDELLASLKAISGDALKPAVEQLARLAEEQRRTEGERVTGELRQHTEAIKGLVDPLAQTTRKVEQEIQRLERDRRQSHGQLSEMMRGLTGEVKSLHSETGNLVSALRRPQTRGAWGEMQLKRAIEMAGMVEHCDFVTQHTINGPDGQLRPDVIVRMPADKVVVVDAKAPLDAYLSAIEADNDDDRAVHLRRHARQVREHMTKLAAKSYAREFDSPELVVMFIPSEGIYHAALQEDPSLLEFGAQQQVLIATPTTLIALLRAVHYGWRQERVEQAAREIAEAGRDLHQRMGPFLASLQKLGRQLGGATNAFNEAIGSMEARVLPQLRRLEQSDASSGRPLESPPPLDSSPRLITAPELSVDDELARLADAPISARRES